MSAMRHPRFELCSCGPGPVRRAVVTGGFLATDDLPSAQARIPVSGQALARVVRPVADRWTHEGDTTLRQRGCFEAVSRETAGQMGCAARDSNPEPLIKRRRN
jgi:hypothetical protein